MCQHTDEQSCFDAELVNLPPCHNQSSTTLPDCPATPSSTADNVNMSSNHPTFIQTITHTLKVIHLTQPTYSHHAIMQANLILSCSVASVWSSPHLICMHVTSTFLRNPSVSVQWKHVGCKCHGRDTTTGNCTYINLCHISWNLFSQVSAQSQPHFLTLTSFLLHVMLRKADSYHQLWLMPCLT